MPAQGAQRSGFEHLCFEAGCSRQKLTTSHHESAYQQRLLEFDHLVSDEEFRRTFLRKLLLEVDNDALGKELACNNNHNDMLERDCETLRECLKRSEQDCQSKLAETQRHARDLETLRAELRSMNSAASDAHKLLDTNLKLKSELIATQEELDQWRRRVAEQQAVAVENTSLRRQVAVLESARMGAQRVNKGSLEESQQSAQTAVLTDQLKELQRKLSDEIQRSEQVQTSMRKQSAQTAILNDQIKELRRSLSDESQRCEQLESAMRKESAADGSRVLELEDKLQHLRVTLRKTKDILKTTQMELKQSREAVLTAGHEVAVGRASVAAPKQKTSQNTTSVDLGTPDGPGACGKRRRHHPRPVDQVSLGEKSTFSITPFLNRTIGFEGRQPTAQCPPADHKLHDDAGPARQGSPTTDPAVLRENRQSVNHSIASVEFPKLSGSGLAKASMHGFQNTNASTELRDLGGSLNIIREKSDENAIDPQPNQLKPKQTGQSFGTAEVVKKRRKVLGHAKTLFDDNDAENPKRHSVMASGAATNAMRRLATLAKADSERHLDGSGVFSPLKRQRRGVGKSFLA